MKKRTLSILFLIAALMFSSISAYAAENMTKTYIFDSTSKAFDYQPPVKDGYKVANIKYTVLEDKGKDVVIEEIKDLKEKKAPKTKTIKSKKYVLDERKTTYQKAKKIGTYVYEARNPNDFTADNEREVKDEKGKTFKGILESTIKGDIYDKAISVDGTFTGDVDSEYFYFANSGTLYPINTAAPLWNGYQEDILTYLNLSPSAYRITGGVWTGESVSGNRLTKKARFSGTSKVCDYTATYTAEDDTKFDASAVYLSPYKVKAVVRYEEILTTVQKVILAGAGIAVLALAAAIIIYILKRRKREEINE